MKKLFLLICLSFSFSLFAEIGLQEAINRQNWLKVDRLMNNIPDVKDSIPQLQYYFIRASVDNALARYDESNRSLLVLSEMQEIKENPNWMIWLLTLQADNYVKTFQYRQSAEIFKKIIDNFGDFLGDESLASYQNAFRMRNAWSEVEPLQVQIPHETKIQLIPDKKEKPQIQVRTPKDSVLLIFDTGAGFSSVTKSVAERLGIRILVDSVAVGGGIGNAEFASIGVADTLFVGDILYKNVVFGVLDDELLIWDEIDYYAHGTLGFPEITALPSIKIHNKTNLMEVFPATKSLQESNMLFNNSQQKFVSVNDSLLFHLDTGSSWTDLSVFYYNRNRERIHEIGQLTSVIRGGIGGSRDFSVYELNDFPIMIGETTTIMPEIKVFTERTFIFGIDDGILGMDIISQFDYMLLDFKNMRFSLGNKEKSD